MCSCGLTGQVRTVGDATEIGTGQRPWPLSRGASTKGRSFRSFSVVRITAWLYRRLLKCPEGVHRKYLWKPSDSVPCPTSPLRASLAGRCPSGTLHGAGSLVSHDAPGLLSPPARLPGHGGRSAPRGQTPGLCCNRTVLSSAFKASLLSVVFQSSEWTRCTSRGSPAFVCPLSELSLLLRKSFLSGPLSGPLSSQGSPRPDGASRVDKC